jgi:phosphomannomutase / phosphoglucomutase
MLTAPRDNLRSNSEEYERLPLVKPTGFREYDAHWLLGRDINLLCIQALGLGLGS